MNIQMIEKEGQGYILCSPGVQPLRTEQDVLDLVSACFEHNNYKLLLHEGALTEQFYNLRTGLAGTALQKFINYHIRAAAVIRTEETAQGRFKELVTEMNKSNAFRVFGSEAEAEAWLLDER
ncbi:hypothetical protein A3842_24985 [Paenibacillus sp. P3E]|uniref:DUF4180 domain-containing protein n=1 Tax=unclassified Paenibacillus TaxID=185978 RepID=UPI0009390646|nr:MULTISPECIES: DUF4180 domain-containing protein [unclassified Paenibacillus]OKP70106.1 hypothetical protein A3842_24985 [Paenibacillus sp. P3E]OKP88926.1 hypothetical protein A3848_16760 [Paenibacillus sp. P32E]